MAKKIGLLSAAIAKGLVLSPTLYGGIISHALAAFIRRPQAEAQIGAVID
jgi:hypothetical protein